MLALPYWGEERGARISRGRPSAIGRRAEYSELRAHLSVHIAYSSPSHRSIELLNHIFVYSAGPGIGTRRIEGCPRAGVEPGSRPAFGSMDAGATSIRMSDAAARFGDGASIRTSYRYWALWGCMPSLLFRLRGDALPYRIVGKDVDWRPGSFPRASNNMW